MSIQENIDAVTEALKAVKGHHMCASFEDRNGQYRVLYPVGMVLDGVQATYANCGKKVALDRMLAAMDKHWAESGI